MSTPKSMPVAIVTGAGSGVGRAVAITLAAKGYALALAGRRRENLEESARLAERQAPTGAASAVVIPTDMADPEQVRSLVDETLARFGRVTALVNNAAMVQMRPIDEADPELLLRILKLNTVGPAIAIAAVLPGFRAQGAGVVVNVSSMATLSPYPGLSAYAASKCAVESLARSVANEAGDADIRAFNVAPGAIETAMLRSIISTEQVPTERCLTPEQVAEVVVALVTGERHEENGATVRLPNPAPDPAPEPAAQ
ncbi:MAG: SDR family oxidoreductase [Phycisphaeraceae bacterium]|nr:SDR family oxidoreductase [Phycisphaeraceae bacterium]